MGDGGKKDEKYKKGLILGVSMKQKINWQEMLPKSSVQAQFPIDKNKLWRSYFWGHLHASFISLISLLFIIFVFRLNESNYALILTAYLVGGCLGLAFWLLDFYPKVNNVVESYYFDVTNDFVMVVAR